MTDSTLTGPTAMAHQETIGLLRQGVDSSPQITGAGYIDVLGEARQIGPRGSQRPFLSRVIAKVYERVWRPIISRLFFLGRSMNAAEERQIVLGMLGVSPGQRVIDVGCGPGNYTRDLGRAASSGLVVGLDAWEPMLTAAVLRGGGENLAYVRGNACSLPFRDESFDVACSVGVIHMVEDPLAALGEMVRVLAPGGKLAVAVTCAGSGGRPLSARLGLTIFGRDEVTGFFAAHGLDEIEQRVVRQGQFVSAHKPAG